MDVPDEHDFTCRSFGTDSIPIAENKLWEQTISVSKPIFNISLAAHSEPKNTAIVLFFKSGCDVHQMDGELGIAIRDYIRLELIFRYRIALQEEVSLQPEIIDLLFDMDPIVTISASVNESKNGEACFEIFNIVLPFGIAASLQKRIGESVSVNPIKFFVFEIEYEVLFCGCGFRFF